MQPTVERALREAGAALTDVDAIAVTVGPGLMGALLGRVSAAKAFALALDKPLYGVNHLAAHVAVDRLEHGPLPQPAIALLVSGGHSSILRVDDVTHDVTALGATIDDAAGEAFDKVARLPVRPALPGGPEIDRIARDGGPQAINFPRGLTASKDLERYPYDFSFSGLKTSVARWVEQRRRDGEVVPVAAVAASSKRRWSTSLRRRRSRPVRKLASTTSCLVAGWPRTVDCVRNWSFAVCRPGDHVAGAASGVVHGQRRHGGGPRCGAAAAGRPPSDLSVAALSTLDVGTVTV